MTPWRERDTIRLIHLVLSIPILGYLYGPVAHIPPAVWFTRWIAMPVVNLSGLWIWLKPRIVKRMYLRKSQALLRVQRLTKEWPVAVRAKAGFGTSREMSPRG
jgi:hypothetical protein